MPCAVFIYGGLELVSIQFEGEKKKINDLLYLRTLDTVGEGKKKEKILFHPINYMDAIPKGEAEWAETPSSVPQHNNTA